MNGLLLLILLIAGTVFLFKAFDRITGRDPKQISDGTEHSRQMRAKRECPPDSTPSVICFTWSLTHSSVTVSGRSIMSSRLPRLSRSAQRLTGADLLPLFGEQPLRELDAVVEIRDLFQLPLLQFGMPMF